MKPATHTVFGIHAVSALLKTEPQRIIQLCIAEERSDKKWEALVQLAQSKAIPFQQQSRQTLDQLAKGGNHQGIIAICQPPRILVEEHLMSMMESLSVPPFLLILDNIQDPHNLGACFRSADAAGVHAIIAPKDNAVGITSVVSKVASGAAETVPFVQVTNLVRTIQHLKERGIWIYGADSESALQTIYHTGQFFF